MKSPLIRKDPDAAGLQRVGHNLVTKQQQQQLIYNVVLVSALQQSESIIHISTLF